MKKDIKKETLNEWLHWAATNEAEVVIKAYGTSSTGLSEQEVLARREKYGENKIEREKKKSFWKLLLEAFWNPFSAILGVIFFVEVGVDIIRPFLLGGYVTWSTSTIIACMIIIAGLLRFSQESKSLGAANRLLDLIKTTCCVIREGQKKEVDIIDLVEGDLVFFSAGDMICADVRLISNKDFFINQASLTGESEPVEKIARVCERQHGTTEYEALAFMGSSVVSGNAIGVVIATGKRTVFGYMAQAIAKEAPQTNFSRGVNAISWLLIKFMLVMVPLVFICNVLTKQNYLEAFLFAISIAVGLTPEMLPMIVTTCLAKGAVAMSAKKTVVKNINSIQNFGAIDVLCTDKTGTLTQDKVVLEFHLDVTGKENVRVLRHAYLNSYFQTGYKNLMDKAIIEKTEAAEALDKTLVDLSENYTKIDEIPFDFTRRRLTTVVKDKLGKVQMVTKGALEEMLAICTYTEWEGTVHILDSKLKTNIKHTVDDLNDRGFRVLAIAQKSCEANRNNFCVNDENNMVLIGYLAFLDPPKESATTAIKALKQHGVRTIILTGDNEKVSRTICKCVGLEVRSFATGDDIEEINDTQLKDLCNTTDVFARLSPMQKERIVKVLQSTGHSVGFLGDGINDAAAMKASDIGISVDTACDIAKESADIILLQKDLNVLENGIIEGRKTYANMIKYIKMTVSSNFGNMFSIVAAAALLPFIPMLPCQIIFLNMIYDCSCTAIPWDNVDEIFLKKPREWNANTISSFMLCFGPLSSIFDWFTYLFMYFIFCPHFAASAALLLHLISPETAILANGVLYSKLSSIVSNTNELMAIKMAYIGMFQAGWFVQSMWSQTLVIHTIRTQALPFVKSHASFSLCTMSAISIAIVSIVAFSPIGQILQFIPINYTYFFYLIPSVILYVILATIIKKFYIKKFGSLL